MDKKNVNVTAGQEAADCSGFLSDFLELDQEVGHR